jgi:hypothetical protein
MEGLTKNEQFIFNISGCQEDYEVKEAGEISHLVWQTLGTQMVQSPTSSLPSKENTRKLLIDILKKQGFYPSLATFLCPTKFFYRCGTITLWI